jgi:hypothetical protein
MKKIGITEASMISPSCPFQDYPELNGQLFLPDSAMPRLTR